MSLVSLDASPEDLVLLNLRPSNAGNGKKTISPGASMQLTPSSEKSWVLALKDFPVGFPSVTPPDQPGKSETSPTGLGSRIGTLPPGLVDGRIPGSPEQGGGPQIGKATKG